VNDHDVDPDRMALDQLLDDLRHAAATTPPPDPGAELAVLFRDGIARPLVVPTMRRSGVRVAVAAAVAGFTLGGLGVAGALPDPVQRRVADVVEHVGVHLPTPAPPATVPVPAPTLAPKSSDAGRNPSDGSGVHPNGGQQADEETDDLGGRSDETHDARNGDDEAGDRGTGHGRGRGIGGSGAGDPDDQRRPPGERDDRGPQDGSHDDDQDRGPDDDQDRGPDDDPDD
jgi:hypothetical protein